MPAFFTMFEVVVVDVGGELVGVGVEPFPE
jgi:hypothetical protein